MGTRRNYQAAACVLGVVALVVAGTAGSASAAGGWSTVAGPASAGGNDTLNAVAGSGEADAWAVGTQFVVPDANLVSARTLAMHWNGAQWTRTVTPSATSNQSLFAVGATSPTDAWAVGSARPSGYNVGVPIAVHWNGSAWSTAATNVASGTLNGVAALAPNNAWAVGVQGRFTQLVEHWDGTAWSAVTVPNPTPASPAAVTKLFAVSAHSANDVWAVGTYNTTNVYALHWDGTTWTPTLVGSPADGALLTPRSVVAAGPNDVWMIENPNVSGGQAYIRHWNGSAWTVSPTPSLGDYPSLTGITARSSSDVWAVGGHLIDITTSSPKRRTQSVHWNGSSWSVVPTSDAEADLNGVAAVPGSNRIWAVGTGSGAFILTRTS